MRWRPVSASSEAVQNADSGKLQVIVCVEHGSLWETGGAESEKEAGGRHQRLFGALLVLLCHEQEGI